MFRFRYERVHGTLKLQKPYVITTRAIKLKAKAPVLVGLDGGCLEHFHANFHAV